MENLNLRKATVSDSEFAYRVKKLAFGAYVDQVWGWDEQEQRQLHSRRFATQEFSVIEWSGIEVGILATVREPENLRINQLFILPEYQGKGIGRACVGRIVDEATEGRYPISLQVLRINSRALTFFERLGFEKTGETDTHIQMERRP